MLHVLRAGQLLTVTVAMPCASCSKGKTVNDAGLEETVRASCSESGTVAEGERVAMPSASCSKGKTVNEAGLELTVRASCSESGTVADGDRVERCLVLHALRARQLTTLAWRRQFVLHDLRAGQFLKVKEWPCQVLHVLRARQLTRLAWS